MKIYDESPREFTLSKVSNTVKNDLLEYIRISEKVKPYFDFAIEMDPTKKRKNNKCLKTTSTVLSIKVTYKEDYRKDRYIALFKQAHPLDLSIKRINVKPMPIVTDIKTGEIMMITPRVMKLSKKFIIKLGFGRSFINGTGGYHHLI